SCESLRCARTRHTRPPFRPVSRGGSRLLGFELTLRHELQQPWGGGRDQPGDDHDVLDPQILYRQATDSPCTPRFASVPSGQRMSTHMSKVAGIPTASTAVSTPRP